MITQDYSAGLAREAASDTPPVGYDERGVDLTLLRARLQLTPLERLQHMERHARDVRILMAYGKRHRETPPR